MSKPSLGEFSGDGQVVVDVARLLETRMLIQAGSGFGKSYVCRRLLEQTAGQVQQLVIDPEGEFATLREKYDYVIAAAHDGDAIAHPRTAQLLARRLLETRVSAVLDIYDLKAHERHAFVKLFCQALVDAPKSLWQPVLVLLDEAHVYCPEQGESAAHGAVTDLATRGRKRGYGLVMATQRLSKLSKDAAAECFNKLIGRCQLDVDVKRAAAELGITPKDATEKFRAFEPGDFFAFGPALCPNVELMHAGKVVTTHPQAGQRGLQAPPAPTAAIKAMLPKLADLPKEAEQEARTLDDLKRDLAAARRELTVARNAKPGASREDLQAAERRGRQFGAEQERKLIIGALSRWQRSLKGQIHQALEVALREIALPPELGTEPGESVIRAPVRQPHQACAPAVAHRGNGAGPTDAAIGTGGKRRILTALAQQGLAVDQRRLALLTGLSSRSGTWSTYLSELRVRGYVEGREALSITPDGLEALGSYEPLPTGTELVEYWRRRLGDSGKRAIFDVVVAAYPQAVNQEEVASTANLSSRSGTWSTYLSELRGLGLVEGRGELRASETLFE